MSSEVTPSVTPLELSLELRTGNSDSMQRRRKVVGLSLVAAGAMGLIAVDAVNAVNTGKLTVDQWTKHRAFCSYCLLNAAVTFAMVPLVVPETRTAFRELTS